MPPTPQITKASIHNTRTDERFVVHFNPENLQYTITNTVRNTGSGNANKQYTGESTGKLSLDLLFDTTSSGEDVRLHTVRVARLMEPGSSANRTPPVVEFNDRFLLDHMQHRSLALYSEIAATPCNDDTPIVRANA